MTYISLAVQMFRIIWTGGNVFTGSSFHMTGLPQLHKPGHMVHHMYYTLKVCHLATPNVVMRIYSFMTVVVFALYCAIKQPV